MKMAMNRLASVLALLVAAAVASGGAYAAATVGEANATIEKFRKKDPGINGFFKSSYGYAVFPTVGKAGIGIGGAYGTGIVYRNGKAIGSAKLSQVSVGFQLGGQAYSEIIFFQTASAFKNLTDDKLSFGAQISAVAVTEGAAAKAAFNRGIAVFTMEKGGLMYEATVAGQNFKYTRW
jgi:lipid-binding SYLF domain-containing protein